MTANSSESIKKIVEGTIRRQIKRSAPSPDLFVAYLTDALVEALEAHVTATMQATLLDTVTLCERYEEENTQLRADLAAAQQQFEELGEMHSKGFKEYCRVRRERDEAVELLRRWEGFSMGLCGTMPCKGSPQPLTNHTRSFIEKVEAK